MVKRDGPWWIGWVEEVPGVNCQEQTKSELLKSLRTTCLEALEMNRDEASRFAVPPHKMDMAEPSRLVIKRSVSRELSR